MASVCLAFQGNLLHTPGKPGTVELLTNHLIIINNHGVMVHLEPAGADSTAVLQEHCIDPSALRVLGPQQFLIPGFVDTHAHAPQYQYCGVGTDLPLIGDNGWLAMYAFPTEASFADVQHARHVYAMCVQRLLRLGTTTANYFTTIHVQGCKALADVVKELGQRAVLGKVCMDQHSPEFYIDKDVDSSLQGAQAVVEYIKLLDKLGQLAAQHDLHIHSHISESIDQVNFSRELHPRCSCDAEIYDQAGLLTNKAIYAHGTQLTDEAMQLLAAKGAAISHCPLSNFYFGDGLFDVSKALSMGLKVGLGTDIAGGYSPSMLQAQRLAVINSHALKAAALMYATWREQEAQPREQLQGDSQEASQHQQTQQQTAAITANDQPSPSVAGVARTHEKRTQQAVLNPAVAAAAAAHMLTWEDALWLATAGGAAALSLQDTVGHFAVGMEFDALLIDVGVEGGPFDVVVGHKDPLILLEQFLNNGDDRNIVEVHVQGKRCWPR